MSIRHLTLMLVLGMALGGCATQRATHFARQPGYFVATAAFLQRPDMPALSTAAQVLPESDEAYYIPRGEKTVEGNTPIYESSSFAVLTYDVQRIASRDDGSGYRYRWSVQQALTIP